MKEKMRRTNDLIIQTEDDYLKIWYDKPADNWKTQALPIGNGNIGGMIFGRTDRERVQFNEITLWSGGPYSNPDYTGGNSTSENVKETVKQIRGKLFEGDTADATFLSEKLLGNSIGWTGYQDIGSIYIDFYGDAKTTKPENYRRELDLKNSLQRVIYTNEGVEFRREYFCSNPDHVMIMHFTCSQEGKLSFDLSLQPNVLSDKLDTLAHSEGRWNEPSKKYVIKADQHTIYCQGKVVTSNMAFAVQVKVIAPGAKLIDNENGSISIRESSDVMILLSAETNYDISEAYNIKEIKDFHSEDGDYLDNQDPDGDLAMERVAGRILAAENLGYKALLDSHRKDYKKLFDRVSLELGDNECAKIPTDVLLENYTRGRKNRYLEYLIFQYGRYLLISSSRDAVLPANLQGLWNDSNSPEWACDYHFDINLQMNYWPAFVTNLEETARPLVSFMDSLRTPGNLTARKCFGVEKGWVVNVQSNIFGMTGTTGRDWTELSWAFTPGCGAWICNNLWDYYLFTQNQEVLRKIYPIIKEAAEFWDSWLIEDPETDELVSAPSMSPEQKTDVGIGSTYDITLSYMLFENVIEAGEVLGVDDAFCSKLKDNLKRMKPFAIGADGQLKEWRCENHYNTDCQGNPIGEAHHRHLSQLLGVHPGNLISRKTPELLEAAKKTLEYRKNGIEEEGVVGWSVIQKANVWARMQDGEKAYAFLTQLFSEGVYQNLFNHVCDVFQIEGNLGATAAVAEMLLQSHNGYIEPLPALPKEWKDGSWKGLKARGNFETDATWREYCLKTLTVYSKSGKDCVIYYPNICMAKVLSKGMPVDIECIGRNMIRFASNKGVEYQIIF